MNSGATRSGHAWQSNMANWPIPGWVLAREPSPRKNLDYAYAVTAVPEPASIMLWIIGSCGWLCRRQRARPA